MASILNNGTVRTLTFSALALTGTFAQANNEKLFEDITTPGYEVSTLQKKLQTKGKCTDNIFFNKKASNSGTCSQAILGATLQLGNAFYNKVNQGKIGTKSQKTGAAMNELKTALAQKNRQLVHTNRPHLERTAEIVNGITGAMFDVENTIGAFWNHETSSTLTAMALSIQHGKVYNFSPLTNKPLTP